MAAVLANEIAGIAAVDLFKRSKTGEIETGLFVARPFYLDYDDFLGKGGNRCAKGAYLEVKVGGFPTPHELRFAAVDLHPHGPASARSDNNLRVESSRLHFR